MTPTLGVTTGSTVPPMLRMTGWVNPTTTTSGGGGSPPGPVVSLKPPPVGFCPTTPGALDPAYPDVTSTRDKTLAWSDVCTGPGVYSRAAVDTAITANLRGGATNVELGIDYGAGAPQWLVTQVGGVAITNTRSGQTVTIPNPCDPRTFTCLQGTVRALGGWYDTDPHVSAMIASWPMGPFTEPPELPGSDTQSAINLYNTGLTQTKQLSLWDQTLALFCAAFPRTHIVWTGHSDWQVCTATGVKRNNFPAMRDWLISKGQQYGKQLVLADYGLAATDTAANNSTSGQTLTGTGSWYVFMQLFAQAYGSAAWQLTLAPPGGGTITESMIRQGYQNAADMGGLWCEHSSVASPGGSDGSAVNAQQAQFRANYNAAVQRGCA